MSFVFFLSSALSLAYFLLIVFYSGIDTDFCGIWIVAALIFLLMGVVHLNEKKHKNEMPRKLPVAVNTSFTLFAGIIAVLMLTIARNAEQPRINGCDYLIVEGDRVYDNGLSKILKLRLDEAIRYKKDNPGTILVLSGGVDEGDLFPEALAMYNYLVLQGIPESDILIESRSETTSDSIRYSLEEISEDLTKRMIPPPIIVGVVTSDYHVFRTLLITEKEYDDLVYPISAPSDPILHLHVYVRECFALVKDYVVGNI